MKKFLKVLAGLVAVLALVVLAIGITAVKKFEKQSSIRYSDRALVEIVEEMKTADVQIGQRIAHIRSGCIECHGEDLSGRVFIDGPPGKIAGPNLTPFALATWSDGEVARAVRAGVGKDHQPLLIMPSHDYQHLSKQDLASVIAYLRTVPSVEKPRFNNEVGPLLKVLYLFGKAPTLFAPELTSEETHFAEKPQEGATAEFGGYIVKTSCMGCHGATLAGGPIPGGPPDWPHASNISATALGNWDEKGFIETMRTGVNPTGNKLRAPMPVEMLKQMSETELKAIWMFLKSK